MALAIDHLGIAVKDLAAACAWYRLLGLQPAAPEEIAAEGVRVVMLPLASGRLELLEPTRPDSPVARFLARRGEGLHHVAFAVEDLPARMETLRAGGVRFVRETIGTGACGRRYIFIHPASAQGVLVELVETARDTLRQD